MAEELLTVAEVAALLKLNQQTVRNWIDRGELPAIRVGPRRIRIKREDVNTILGRQGQQAPPAPPSPLVEPDVIEALREFSQAASKLADALERSHQPN